ncbi:GDSL esterase/lipase-like [Dorcoceras hygrometricum]|uniref:GDSL esterase/lipase-like n=1 Tax=Dorcoceras hygrometricum TaxID=472368 RepID=A0A2Z7C1G6_9LAMI|nr:GDSL esterase/lipase-like [Dorcoceras hygrometricum]
MVSSVLIFALSWISLDICWTSLEVLCWISLEVLYWTSFGVPFCSSSGISVGIGPDPHPGRQRKNKIEYRDAINTKNSIINVSTYIGCLAGHLSGTCAWLQPVFQEPGASRLIAVDSSIRSTTRLEAPSSDCTRSPDEISTIGFSTSNWPETVFREVAAAQGRRRRRLKWRGGEGGYALGLGYDVM